MTNFSFLNRALQFTLLWALSSLVQAQPAGQGSAEASVTTGGLIAEAVTTASKGVAGSQTPPRLTEDAQAALQQIREAYAALDSLEVTGTLTTDFEIAGRVDKSEKPLSGSFLAPNLFRQRLGEELVAGSTGETVYLHNLQTGEMVTTSASGQLPEPLVQLLRLQNPSLLLAFTREPLESLAADPGTVTQLEDEKLEGKRYTALQFEMPQRRGVFTALVDKESNLLRRVTADLKPGLDRAGVAGVRSARYVIDYSRTRPGAALEKTYFAWEAPAGGGKN